jgi:integrase
MPLTDTAIKNARSRESQYKLFDGAGLFLLVAPAGGKWWRLKYRFGGKEKLLSLGTYPLVSLKEARERREEAKKLLANGIDPGLHRQAVKSSILSAHGNTFEVVAREWYAKHSSTLVDSHKKKILSRLEKQLFPFIGAYPIQQIEAPHILAAVSHAERRGAVDTAHRLVQLCGQVFRYAIVTGRAKHDISADLRGALQAVAVRHRAAITEPQKIGMLLRAIDGYEGYFPLTCALRLAPLVFLRPGELRKGEWAEINIDAAEWRILPERMKMRQTHIVPLSIQAVAVLEELRPITGHGRYLFPSVRSDSRPITDEALLAALRSMGFTKEEMSVHGFRGMASTLLNEKGYNRDWIERQLAHGERNGVRAAYNYAEYLPERRKMMQEWADYLSGLKEKARKEA